MAGAWPQVRSRRLSESDLQLKWELHLATAAGGLYIATHRGVQLGIGLASDAVRQHGVSHGFKKDKVWSRFSDLHAEVEFDGGQGSPAYIRHSGNQSAAWKEPHPDSKAKPATMHEKASRFFVQGKVRARISSTVEVYGGRRTAKSRGNYGACYGGAGLGGYCTVGGGNKAGGAGTAGCAIFEWYA